MLEGEEAVKTDDERGNDVDHVILGCSDSDLNIGAEFCCSAALCAGAEYWGKRRLGADWQKACVFEWFIGSLLFCIASFVASYSGAR